MGSYEIPKEIRAKPQLMGLEMKELVILLIGFFSILTFLKDMVHGTLVIPFLIVAILFLLWLVMPSRNNPTRRNYMSLFFLFKRDRATYHAVDHHKFKNKIIVEGVEELKGG